MVNIGFFEKIGCGALICKNDEYSTILEANSEFYKMIGYTKEEMKTLHQNRFSELVVDDLSEILEKVNQAVDSKKRLDYEYRIKNKDNKIMWIHDVAVYDEEENVFYVVIMDITYREENLERIYNILEKDLLSNLLNRRALEKKIKEQMKENKSSQALIIIDLDNFKILNDTLGHQEGDRVISFVGLKLKEIFKNNETLGRLGGDEFAIYLEDISKKDLENYAKKLVKQLEVTIEDIKIHSTIGIAFDKKGIYSFEELYKLSDTALYSLKKNDNKGKYLISVS